jgi:hypothetical protein
MPGISDLAGLAMSATPYGAVGSAVTTALPAVTSALGALGGSDGGSPKSGDARSGDASSSARFNQVFGKTFGDFNVASAPSASAASSGVNYAALFAAASLGLTLGYLILNKKT